MSDALPVLRAVRDLLSNPDAWTTDRLAADDDGCETSPLAPDACSWCLMGAVIKVARIEETDDYDDQADRAERHPGYQAMLDQLEAEGWAGSAILAIERNREWVPEFNDHIDTRHSDVLALLDAAIARLSPQ